MYNVVHMEFWGICAQINCYYFDGDYVKIRQLCNDNKSLVRFINSSKFENEYFKIICSLDKKNQHKMYLEFNLLSKIVIG